jgi:hypothetical protein
MSESGVRAPLRELIGPIVGTIVFFFLAPGTVGFCCWPRLHPWRAGS